MKPLVISGRVHPEAPGWCWELGIGGRRYNWATHVSVGGPTWWRPTAGRKRYSGITEWRAGWLWIAVQIARKARR